MFRMLIGGYKMDIPKIYFAMANVQQYMVENPIGKNDENKFQKYKYRGIEAVVQAFSKPLKENQIILLPQEVKVSTRYKNEKTSLTRITGSLRFVCLEDVYFLERSYEGHSESTQGKDLEAAKSFAYRDALLETFCVPFEQVEPETTDEENEEMKIEHFFVCVNRTFCCTESHVSGDTRIFTEEHKCNGIVGVLANV